MFVCLLIIGMLSLQDMVYVVADKLERYLSQQEQLRAQIRLLEDVLQPEPSPKEIKIPIKTDGSTCECAELIE